MERRIIGRAHWRARMRFLATAAGNPATLCLIHLFDVRKVIREGLAPLLIELQQWQDEWWHVTLLRSSERAGKLLARCDVTHVAELSLFHFDIASSRVLRHVLEGAKHYPESCARIVSTGNNRVLIAMYNSIIRPFVPAHTREKLVVLGRDLESDESRECISFDDTTFSALLELTSGHATP